MGRHIRFVMAAALALACAMVARPAFAGPNDGLPPPAREVDLSTPRRALGAFLRHAEQNEWVEAARVLDLRSIPRTQQAAQAPQLAQSLASVLLAYGVEPAALPDEPEGQGEARIEIARIPGEPQPLELHRVSFDGDDLWVFSRVTVRLAPQLETEINRGPIGNLMPPALIEPRIGGLEPWQWIGTAGNIAFAILVALFLGRAVIWIVRRSVSDEARPHVTRAVIGRARGPLRAMFALATLGLLATLTHYSPAVIDTVRPIYLTAWLLTVGWIAVRAVDYVAERIAEKAAAEQGWRSRGVRTRVMVLRRVMHVISVVLLAAIFLMQFEAVREVGVSLLASAGVAGLVVGLAAQRTISSLFAGLQLSFTQPLRVGDSVVIEGEFGTVEEINLSYVVLKIWDERRLIVPMSKLLETSFQNWTRSSSEIIGEVKMSVDFETPFDTLRTTITEFVKGHPLFDGRVVSVAVVDATERTALLRVLVSAADAGKAFDLRCAVREWLIVHLRELERGRYLPRVRVDDPNDEGQGGNGKSKVAAN